MRVKASEMLDSILFSHKIVPGFYAGDRFLCYVL